MLNSKSFGYAVRGILFLTLQNNHNKYVLLESISRNINAPKHFLAKIFRKLAEADLVDSVKGPKGGFRAHERTLHTSLWQVLMVTDPQDPFNHCILKWKKCNAKRPCPLHHQVVPVKNQLIELLHNTEIKDLISKNKKEVLDQILE